MQVRVFGREPAVWLAVIGALLTWAAGFGFEFLNAGQATAITTALTGVLIALTTRPVAPGLFTAALAPTAALFAQYGLHWSEASVTGLAGLILATFAFFGVRPQVTPNADPVPISPANGQVR